MVSNGPMARPAGGMLVKARSDTNFGELVVVVVLATHGEMSRINGNRNISPKTRLQDMEKNVRVLH